jgi:hypothetical protein
MKNQSNFMQNLPAVANLFSSYYDGNSMSQLFNKLPSSTNFLNNNLFNNGTSNGLEALFKQLPTTLPKMEPQTPAQDINDAHQLDLSPKKSPKNPASANKKEGKSKKIVHSCPHCNFTTVGFLVAIVIHWINWDINVISSGNVPAHEITLGSP